MERDGWGLVMTLFDFFKDEQIMYYDAECQKLYGTRKYKANKLLTQGLIHKNGDTYIIEPIKGYNKTTYIVKKDGNAYTCTCQHYNRFGTERSHIIACKIKENYYD